MRGCGRVLHCITLAVSAMRSAISIARSSENPHNFHACYYKARSHQELEEFSEAIDAFDHALEIDSQVTRIPIFSGAQRSLPSRGLRTRFMRLTRALLVDNGYAPAHYHRGFILIKLGRQREAIDAFDRCIAITPQYRPGALSEGKGTLFDRAEPGLCLCIRPGT